MNLQTAPDVPLLVTVPSTTTSKDSSDGRLHPPPPQLSAERRISPSWSVAQLKAKLEPVTGIPPGSQSVRIRAPDGSWSVVKGGDDDDDQRLIGEWGLRRGGEMEIHDLRPPSLSSPTTTASVEKYSMPTSQYEKLNDSVLQWKRTRQLGRFDPNAKTAAQLSVERAAKDDSEVAERGIEVGRRCRVGKRSGDGDDDGGWRRGVVRFVGVVEGLGREERESGARWVGVGLDEPVGRNDGSVDVRAKVRARKEDEDEEDKEEEVEETRKVRLFECKPGFGVLVRPEKVEVGEEWVPLDDLEVDEDLEEL